MILPVLKDISQPDDSTNEEKSCQVGNQVLFINTLHPFVAAFA
jgi:hypothetical protein